MTRGKAVQFMITASCACMAAGFAVAGFGESGRRSTSVGGPNNGKLIHGVQLPPRGKGFVSNQARTNANADHGTEELIAAIRKIGSDLERWAPGSTLVVNDLSFLDGGQIPRHQSHQSGRDVDFLFYTTDTAGKAIRTGALRFNEQGEASSESAGTVLFDRQRNWLLLKSLVLNQEAHLQRVFIAERLRKLMLDHARANDEPRWLIERAAQAMCEPAVPHDDHSHVRLFCTAEDYRRGCRDSWPIYPWRRTEMAILGLGALETAPPKTIKRRRQARPHTGFGRVWCPSPR